MFFFPKNEEVKEQNIFLNISNALDCVLFSIADHQESSNQNHIDITLRMTIKEKMKVYVLMRLSWTVLMGM